MSNTQEDSTDCVVVRCGGCKRIVFTAVNEPRVMGAENRNAVGEMVAEGCTVEHMAVEEVRKAAFGCKCQK